MRFKALLRKTLILRSKHLVAKIKIIIILFFRIQNTKKKGKNKNNKKKKVNKILKILIHLTTYSLIHFGLWHTKMMAH